MKALVISSLVGGSRCDEQTEGAPDLHNSLTIIRLNGHHIEALGSLPSARRLEWLVCFNMVT